MARTDEVVRQVNDITLNTLGNKHTSPVSRLDLTTNTIAPNVGTVLTSLPSLYGEHIQGINAALMVKTLRQKFAGFKGANILVINPPAVKGLGSAIEGTQCDAWLGLTRCVQEGNVKVLHVGADLRQRWWNRALLR